MKFKVTEYIGKFMKVGEEYQTIDVEKKYEANTWDDLQTLIMTLTDFSSGAVKFKIEKEVETDGK